MTPWKLPLIVGAMAIPTIAGFVLIGPGAGVAIGGIAGVTLLLVALAQRPRDPIGSATQQGDRRRVLIVIAGPVEDPAAVEQIDTVARLGDSADPAEVMVLSPARIGFWDRWASDVEGARRRAQDNLVVTVAALAKAGIVAEARVGDEDFVQAIEDLIGSYDADEVMLVSGDEEEGHSVGPAAAELSERLRPRFHYLRLG